MGGILMQIFFYKKKSTSYHDADDPRNGEGMGGDWKRDTLQTPPNIPPRNTHPPPHNVCGGRGDSSSGQKKHKELRKNEKKKKGSF